VEKRLDYCLNSAEDTARKLSSSQHMEGNRLREGVGGEDAGKTIHRGTAWKGRKPFVGFSYKKGQEVYSRMKWFDGSLREAGD